MDVSAVYFIYLRISVPVISAMHHKPVGCFVLDPALTKRSGVFGSARETPGSTMATPGMAAIDANLVFTTSSHIRLN